MSSCFASSRLRMRTAAMSMASRRRAMVDPNEPVPPVIRTVAPESWSVTAATPSYRLPRVRQHAHAHERRWTFPSRSRAYHNPVRAPVSRKGRVPHYAGWARLAALGKATSLELRDYLHVLRRGWPVVLVFVVLGVAAGVLLTVTSTKIYQASVQMFVATSTSQSATDLAQGNIFTQDRVQSYTAIATSPQVTGPVIHSLGVPLTDSDLAAKISADAPQNKVLINLH